MMNQKISETRVRIKASMDGIGRKIVVMSGKGGVGKTTVAMNLAVALSEKGFKTGILDVDIHGPNVPIMLGLEGSRVMSDGETILPVMSINGLKVVSTSFLLDTQDSPVIWRGPMKIQVINQFLGFVDWGGLDYLIIDLPPGTGDESLSIAQEIPGAEAVIVTTPQEVALLDSRKAVNFAGMLNMKVLGIIENMSGFECPHCGKGVELFKTGGGEKAAGELGVPFLGRIPFDPEIVRKGDDGDPLVLEEGGTAAAEAFSAIVERILSRVIP